MNDFDVQNSKLSIINRNDNYLNIYLKICICLVLLLFVISISYSYHNYLNYYGQIILEDDTYYVKVYIKEEEISLIPNSKLIINNKEYKYHIYYISKEYYVDEKYHKYYSIYIRTAIDSSLIIENNIINMYFQLPKQTLFKRLLEKIKEGIM